MADGVDPGEERGFEPSRKRADESVGWSEVGAGGEKSVGGVVEGLEGEEGESLVLCGDLGTLTLVN